MSNYSGAIPSNAGDYFHFTYIVRSMLDMLHPTVFTMILRVATFVRSVSNYVYTAA